MAARRRKIELICALNKMTLSSNVKFHVIYLNIFTDDMMSALFFHLKGPWIMMYSSGIKLAV